MPTAGVIQANQLDLVLNVPETEYFGFCVSNMAYCLGTRHIERVIVDNLSKYNIHENT